MLIADCGSSAIHSRDAWKGLFDLLDRGDDDVEVGPVAGVEFGMDEFVIGANLEGATARGNEGERLDTLAEFKNFCRQTDGFRRVVSNHAVFDRYFGFHSSSFPISRLGSAEIAVNGLGAVNFHASGVLRSTKPGNYVLIVPASGESRGSGAILCGNYP